MISDIILTDNIPFYPLIISSGSSQSVWMIHSCICYTLTNVAISYT